MEHNRVNYRHIHLDFHTSELIEGIGSQFDPDEFADTLKNAHVNSITLFTRCHHGNLYYDSKLYPERIHPHLARKDFLEAQVAVCHERGIDVNLYTTVCWDGRVAKEHPEWVCINEHGQLDDFKHKDYFEAGFYKNLCMNTGYREYCFSQFEEALRLIPAEGVWFDAAFIVECCCPTCQARMRELGMNPADPEHRKAFAQLTYESWVREAVERVRAINPNYNVTFNKGHVGTTERNVRSSYTYYAIESLPGAEWGYMDFPISVKYNRNFGADCVGMTGRFHTEWGDFSSFRNKEALEYECFSMLANGAKCIIGDQLEPCGKLNKYMYERIGEVYASVEEKEPWCESAKPVSEIGVLSPEEFHGAGVGSIPPAAEGVARLLQELAYQYDIIDTTADFSRYRLLVLPDVIPVNASLAEKLNDFLANGGKILASFQSGIMPDEKRFAIELGVNYLGEAPCSPDFIVPSVLGRDLYPTEYVMYKRGALVEANAAGRVIEFAIKPVFNRSWEHFCSHLHSPSSGERAYPAVVETNNTIYFIHPIFTQFQDNAIPWVRALLKNALERIMPDKLVSHNAPISMISTLLEQEHEKRFILHLLHYIPEHKCKSLDIIDTKIPLYNVDIAVKAMGNDITSVKCQPQNEALDFVMESGCVSFTVPKVDGHQIIELSYA